MIKGLAGAEAAAAAAWGSKARARPVSPSAPLCITEAAELLGRRCVALGYELAQWERLWAESGSREAAEMAANTVGRKRSKAQRGEAAEERSELPLWLRIRFPVMNHMCSGGRERWRE